VLRLDDDFISCQFDDQNASDESGFHDVMGFMDDELKNTSIPKSFQDPDGNQVCLCLPPLSNQITLNLKVIKKIVRLIEAKDNSFGVYEAFLSFSVLTVNHFSTRFLPRKTKYV